MINFYNRPMQEFGEQTLISLYIQNLIASTSLPICDTVSDGDFIVKGSQYIYNFDLIECTQTGYIGIEEIPPLTPSSDLYPSEALLPRSGMARAKYKIITQFHFGQSYRGLTYRYTPNKTYYDSDTHYHLGVYLRCIRDIYGVNYMPFYNCYNAKNLHGIKQEIPYEYIYAIPIRFNTQYTMSYQSNSSAMIKAVIYSDRSIDFGQYVGEDFERGEELKKELAKITTPALIPSRKYSDLYKFSVDTDNEILYKFQKYLYIVLGSETKIQSLSVIEGNYTYTNDITIGGDGNSNQFNVVSKLKLLDTENRDKSYAFSNRLFEGLLHHTINRQDENQYDIGRVQGKLGMTVNNIWDDKIQIDAFRSYMSTLALKNDYYNYFDINGNIDKDVEYYLFGNDISAR